MLIQGFKFGMLLQIAIGPVCIYIFSLGTTQKFSYALTGVLGVALADAMYMIFAILGISSFIKDENTQKKFNLLGSTIVILFGLELLLGYFEFSILPKLNIFNGSTSNLPFLKTFLLTAANPMTILFWIGVFSTKISQKDFNNRNILAFSVGALSATLIFLTFILFTGTLTSNFLTDKFMIFLNAVVGIILIYFGVKRGVAVLWRK